MINFEDFYNEHLNIITEKYNRDIIKEISGNHNISEIIGTLIGYNTNCLTDVLDAYTTWSLDNFDVHPKF